jgi:hypothetical protein
MQFAKKAQIKRVCLKKVYYPKRQKEFEKGNSISVKRMTLTIERWMHAHEDYQVNVFNVVMDQIVTSSNSRFENHKDFTKIFPVWTLAKLMNAKTEAASKCISVKIASLCEKIGNHAC